MPRIERGGHVEVAHRRRDRHRNVHRQRLAPDLGDRLGQRDAPPRRRAPATPRSSRERDHPFRARIERFVQGDGRNPGIAPPRGAIVRATPSAASLRVAPASTWPSASSSSLRHRSAAPRITVPQPKTPAATAPCKRRRVGRIGHARGLHRGRQPMLGEREQADVEEKGLVFGRRSSGREKEEKFGEARLAHQFGGEVAPAYADRVGPRRGNRRRRARRACLSS